MAADYPNRVEICPWGYWEHVVAGGTITRFQDSSILSGGLVYQGTPAQNDEIGWKVLLRAGTWTITLIHFRSTDRGIYTVKLDTTSIGTIDGYGSAAGNVVSAITGVSVSTPALYTLKLVMATKHASSSNYYYAPQWIICQRTGA